MPSLVKRNFICDANIYRHLRIKRKFPMKERTKLTYIYFCVIFVLLETFVNIDFPPGVNASIVTVDESGAYNKLTVKITDDVPRPLCQQTLDTLEVRMVYFLKAFCPTGFSNDLF